MAAPVYLGDEASAAGFRLAGVRCVVPEPGTEAAALEQARATAPLVLVAAPVAAGVPAAAMRAALAALAPLTVIVPDLAGRVPLPDVAARLRRELGLEA